jgi:hypothetical protein
MPRGSSLQIFIGGSTMTRAAGARDALRLTTQLLRAPADNETMSLPVRWYIDTSCWCASLAYAAGFKRAGHRYFTGAVGALYISCVDGEVVFGKRMPSSIAAPTPWG